METDSSSYHPKLLPLIFQSVSFPPLAMCDTCVFYIFSIIFELKSTGVTFVFSI